MCSRVGTTALPEFHRQEVVSTRVLALKLGCLLEAAGELQPVLTLRSHPEAVCGPGSGRLQAQGTAICGTLQTAGPQVLQGRAQCASAPLGGAARSAAAQSAAHLPRLRQAGRGACSGWGRGSEARARPRLLSCVCLPDPVAVLMLLVDADRPEPVRSGARELALFLTPEPGAEVGTAGVEGEGGIRLGIGAPNPDGVPRRPPQHPLAPGRTGRGRLRRGARWYPGPPRDAQHVAPAPGPHVPRGALRRPAGPIPSCPLLTPAAPSPSLPAVPEAAGP
jgi:hypothetical protein